MTPATPSFLGWLLPTLAGEEDVLAVAAAAEGAAMPGVEEGAAVGVGLTGPLFSTVAGEEDDLAVAAEEKGAAMAGEEESAAVGVGSLTGPSAVAT